jgi:hypothetical protein
MASATPEQLTADSEALLKEWEALDKEDPQALLEHLGKLKALATFLSAEVRSPDVPLA